jgi:hypothetical protein
VSRNDIFIKLATVHTDAWIAQPGNHHVLIWMSLARSTNDGESCNAGQSRCTISNSPCQWSVHPGAKFPLAAVACGMTGQNSLEKPWETGFTMVSCRISLGARVISSTATGKFF